jgi:hypothetical protein
MASHGCGLALMRSMTSSSVKFNQAVQEHLVNQEEIAGGISWLWDAAHSESLS